MTAIRHRFFVYFNLNKLLHTILGLSIKVIEVFILEIHNGCVRPYTTRNVV